MQDKFLETVPDLSGREVLGFISNSHVGPDMEIELFFLGRSIARSDSERAVS